MNTSTQVNNHRRNNISKKGAAIMTKTKTPKLISISTRTPTPVEAAAIVAADPSSQLAEKLAAEQPVVVKVKKERKPRVIKGLVPADVDQLLRSSGLILTEKSANHWGDIKGTRLVVPRSKSITIMYVYNSEDSSLPGYRSPEQRKLEGLGKVTHIIEKPTLEQVTTAINSVRKVYGLMPVEELASPVVVQNASGAPEAVQAKNPKAKGKKTAQTNGKVEK